MSFHIIDSHIHLYAASHIGRLNWTADLPPYHALNRQNSVEQYRKATAGANPLCGFVFLETDRKSGLQDNDWDDALEEVSFLARIAQGKPIPGEGHSVEDKILVLRIVPWAPVPAGPEALARYMKKVQERSGKSYVKIKGVRYLLQDKPAGTMLAPSFIESLQWLADQGLSFDLGIDTHSGGLHQLEEASEMLELVYANGSGLKLIINHMCKPNFDITPEEVEAGHSEFAQWKDCIARMASHQNTYMKLSGMFSELPPQSPDKPIDIDELVRRTKPWVDAVFECFGSSRTMFGSDWPVCNMNGPGIQNSWSHYVALLTAILDSHSLDNEQKAQVWAGTAARAYKIDL